MQKAYEKLIAEYKETNVELQKNVGIEPLADIGGKSTATGSFVSMSFNAEEASGQAVSMLKTFIIRPLMLNK